MKYRLCIINPEGTILDSDGQVNPEAQKALIEAENRAEIRIVLIGYKPLDELIPLGQALQLEAFSGYLLSPTEEVLYNCHTQRKSLYREANVVNYFVQKLDLLPEEVIAIGANLVDIEMIQSAGLGVAMAQAEESVKTIAQYVTLSNDDGGIEHFAEKYLRKTGSELPYTVEEVNSLLQNSLITRLGMTATVIAEGFVEMTMPVDNWTSQPMGILHGGANLALAETAAGLGSMILAQEGTVQVGIQVSGYHVGRAIIGDTMRAEARILHQGKSTHVWSVEIYSMKTNKLIHTAKVLNSIIKIR